MILVKTTGFIFGKPDNLEQITSDIKPHGFTVRPDHNGWLRAYGKRRTWYIEDAGTHWRLSAEGPRHERKHVKFRREMRTWSDDLQHALREKPQKCFRDDVFSLAIKKGAA